MHVDLTPANRLVDPGIQPWFTAYIFGLGHSCHGQLTPVHVEARYLLNTIT